MGYISDLLVIARSDPIKTLCRLIPRVHWLTAVLAFSAAPPPSVSSQSASLWTQCSDTLFNSSLGWTLLFVSP